MFRLIKFLITGKSVCDHTWEILHTADYEERFVEQYRQPEIFFKGKTYTLRCIKCGNLKTYINKG